MNSIPYRKRYLYSDCPVPKQTKWYRRKRRRNGDQNIDVRNAQLNSIEAEVSLESETPSTCPSSRFQPIEEVLSTSSEHISNVCVDQGKETPIVDHILPTDVQLQSTLLQSSSESDSDSEFSSTEESPNLLTTGVISVLTDAENHLSESLPFEEDGDSSLDSDSFELYCEETMENLHENSGGEDDAQQNLLLPISKCASVSEGDILVMCLSLGQRHCLSWAAMVDILRMINTIFDCEVIKASKYFFQKYMSVGKNFLTYHLYCSNCEQYLGSKKELSGKNIICECNNNQDPSQPTTFFLSLDLESQLKDLFEDEQFVNNLQYRFNRKKENPNALEDIFDGCIYKKLSAPGQVLSEWQNISYIFNTDGVPIGKSSRQTMWPIYVQINELPPFMRSKYMLLAGIYVGKKDPNMKIFLHPFVSTANKLSSSGINWHLNGKLINTKVVPLASCVDSVARCQMLNMKQYNGYYGCTMCYHKGKRPEDSRGIKYPVKVGVQNRTHESILADSRTAFLNRNHPDRNKRVCKGVKGPSPLHYLRYLDLVNGITPDHMHSVFLGNIKHLMDILLKSTGKPYYIGSEHVQSAISTRLMSIKPPSMITRTPRPLKDIPMWKASEWRSWLLFYAVPCLKGILPDKYVAHLSMLSTAICILLQKSVTHEQVGKAGKLLTRYVYEHQLHYGEVSMVYNVHLLLHLRQSVLNLGPLFAHNTFSFEGQNRHLLQMQKSPSSVAQEVSKKYLVYKSLPKLCQNIATSQSAVKFCEEIRQQSLKSVVRNGDTVLVGNGSQLTGDEKKILSEAGILYYEKAKSFQRMWYNKIRYTCSSYGSPTKLFNDSYVILSQGVYGLIEKIFSIQKDGKSSTVVLVKKLELSQQPILLDNYGKESHIKFVVGQSDIIVIEPSLLSGHCLAMKLDHGFFASVVPYGCHGD